MLHEDPHITEIWIRLSGWGRSPSLPDLAPRPLDGREEFERWWHHMGCEGSWEDHANLSSKIYHSLVKEGCLEYHVEDAVNEAFHTTYKRNIVPGQAAFQRDGCLRAFITNGARWNCWRYKRRSFPSLNAMGESGRSLHETVPAPPESNPVAESQDRLEELSLWERIREILRKRADDEERVKGRAPDARRQQESRAMRIARSIRVLNDLADQDPPRLLQIVREMLGKDDGDLVMKFLDRKLDPGGRNQLRKLEKILGSLRLDSLSADHLTALELLPRRHHEILDAKFNANPPRSDSEAAAILGIDTADYQARLHATCDALAVLLIALSHSKTGKGVTHIKERVPGSGLTADQTALVIAVIAKGGRNYHDTGDRLRSALEDLASEAARLKLEIDDAKSQILGALLTLYKNDKP